MKTIFINNHMQRGACYENILIQIRPVYDDLIDTGVLPWARASRRGSRAQAKQYTEAYQNNQANQHPQTDQYPQVHVYAYAHILTDCHGYVHEHTHSDIYTNRHANGYACASQPARLLEIR